MRVLSAHTKPVNCVAFSPDGARLAEAAHGGKVRVWDVAAGEVAQTFEVKGMFPNRIRLAFSPDGSKLAATNAGVVLIDLAGGKQRRMSRAGNYDVAFAPDGKHLVASGDSRGHWDADTGEALRGIDLPIPRGFKMMGWPACAFSPDGSRLAISRRLTRVVGEFWRNTDQLLIYAFAGKKVATEFEWTGHPAHRVAFSPDGALVAAACGPVLRAWDIATGKQVAEKQVGKLHFLGMAFSPDGRYVGTVSKDRTTRLWEVGAWGDPKTYEWDAGKLLDIAFSPDGTTAAVASDEGKVVLFDVD